MFTSCSIAAAGKHVTRYEMTGGDNGGQDTGFNENDYGSIVPDPALWFFPGSAPNNRIEDLIHNASGQTVFFAMRADSGGSQPNTDVNWREMKITGEFTTGVGTEVYVRADADVNGTGTNRRTWTWNGRSAKFLTNRVYQVELFK